jgi:hypothetical protein
MARSKITNRIEAETGMPRLLSALTEEIAPSDLKSLLLSVYKNRAQSIHESDLLDRTGRDALFAPSAIDPRILNCFDRHAFDAAGDFEAIDLSPVCPLGTNFVLGGIDQNNVLTTIRNAEVLGDPTPALAIECARRRKGLAERSAGRRVRLCSSHRVVRLQPFDVPGFTPHFRLFGLVSAGRDTGSNVVETEQIGEHIRFYLKLFRALNTAGFSLTKPLVEVSDLTISGILLGAAGISAAEVRESVRAHIPGGSARLLKERGVTLPADIADPARELNGLAQQHGLEIQLRRLVQIKEQVFDSLKAEYPEADFRFNLARLEGLGYYTGLCLRVSPAAPDGLRHGIADGGFTDWTARLLQDRKERFFISGIGSEYACRAYRARQET